MRISWFTHQAYFLLCLLTTSVVGPFGLGGYAHAEDVVSSDQAAFASPLERGWPLTEDSLSRWMGRASSVYLETSSKVVDGGPSRENYVRVSGPLLFFKIKNAPIGIPKGQVFAVASAHVCDGEKLELFDALHQPLKAKGRAVARLEDLVVFEIDDLSPQIKQVADFQYDMTTMTLRSVRQVSASLIKSLKSKAVETNPTITRFYETNEREMTFVLRPTGQRMVAETYGTIAWFEVGKGFAGGDSRRKHTTLADDVLGLRKVGMAQVYPGYSGSPVLHAYFENAANAYLEVTGFVSQSHRILPLTYFTSINGLGKLLNRYLTIREGSRSAIDLQLLSVQNFGAVDQKSENSKDTVSSSQAETIVPSKLLRWILRNGRVEQVFSARSYADESSVEASARDASFNGGKTTGNGGGKTSVSGAGRSLGLPEFYAPPKSAIAAWQREVLDTDSVDEIGNGKEATNNYLILTSRSTQKSLVLADEPRTRVWLLNQSGAETEEFEMKECRIPLAHASEDADCQPQLWLTSKLMMASEQGGVIVRSQSQAPDVFAEVEELDGGGLQIRVQLKRRSFKLTIDSKGNFVRQKSSHVLRGDVGYFPQVFLVSNGAQEFFVDIRGLYFTNLSEAIRTGNGLGATNVASLRSLMKEARQSVARPKIYVRDSRNKIVLEFLF